jgi:hypothetical protein
MSNIPVSPSPVQQEGAQATRPVSESLLFSVGGAVNYALTNSGKIGDVVDSLLGEAAFQALRDTTWALMDGRSLIGTDLGNLTGMTVLPDTRGTYLRACDNGRGLDPNGQRNPGDYVGDQVGSHTHTMLGCPSGGGDGASYNGLLAESFLSPNGRTAGAGGSETAPKTTYINQFCKINT